MSLLLDLFAGPGGVDEGARLAGYTGQLVGIEWDMAACRTAMAAGHPRIRADVASYPTAPFVGRVDGLWCSPPCPTFSSAGNGGGKLDMDKVHDRIRAFANGRQLAEVEWKDDRSRLTAEPMRWAYALRPRWIACEQVPAVLPLWQHTAILLRGLGYSTWCGVLSAEEYGVAQTRKRAILIARLDAPARPPAPTHQAYVAGRDPQVHDDLFGSPLPPPRSMAEALGWDVGGVELRNGNQERACVRSLDEPAGTMFFGQRANAVDWILRSNYGTGGDPQDRGERRADEPAPTATGKVGRNLWMAPAGATSQMVDPRPDSDPAHTITGKGTAAWVQDRPSTTVCDDPRIGRPGHKDRDQGEAQFDRDSVRVTVEEAGILQSFRPDYPWTGTKTEQYLCVGNAVPPLLAAAILRPLLTPAEEVAA